MAYEYDRGLGATGVTVYGTLPEAQEYVAEEFDLPWPVPAFTVLPPVSPRKPRTTITIFRPEDALGVDDVCTGLGCWLERHKPLVWVAGIAAGMLGMRWLLKRRQRRMLENPSPKDIKLAETARDGSIPLRRGKYKPLDPEELEDVDTPPGVNRFLEACYQLRPDLRERYEGLRKPVKPKRPAGAKSPPYWWNYSKKKRDKHLTKSPEDKVRFEAFIKHQKELQVFDTFALPRYYRRRFERDILAYGRSWYSPEKWVGMKLFDRLRSFVMPCFRPEDYAAKRPRGRQRVRRVGGRYRTASSAAAQRDTDKDRIELAFQLWTALGLPNGSTLTARGMDTVCRNLRLKRLGMHRTQDLISRVQDAGGSPRIMWQVISIVGSRHLSDEDLEHLLVELHEAVATDKAHRIRWWAERNITNHLHSARETIPSWDFLDHRRIWRHHSIGWKSREQERKSKHPEFGRLASRTPSRRGGPRRGRYRRAALPWAELPSVLAAPERSFIAEYAPSPGDAYSWLYNRLPKKDDMRRLTPPTVAALPMKELLRLKKSSEIRGMLDHELEVKQEEQILRAERRLKEEQEDISRTEKKIANLKDSVRHLKAWPKQQKKGTTTPQERGQWLGQLSKRRAQLKRARKSLRWHKRMVRRHEEDLKGKLPAHVEERIRRDFDPNIQHAALSLAIVFGSNWRSWVQKMERRHIDLHDATDWLPLEASPGLGEYLLKRWQANMKDLRAVAKGWNALTKTEQRLPPQEISAILAARVYLKATVPALAVEAAKWGVPEDDYYRIEQEWNRALAEKDKHPSSIPSFVIQRPGYRLSKLEPDDTRGLFLGEYTYCCQHPMGVGRQCAWHGVYSPDGAFYALEDRKGTIIGQAWTWRNGSDIVFDSLEGPAFEDDRHAMANEMFIELAETMVKAGNADRVLSGSYVGHRYETVERRKLAALPGDYPPRGYSDARGHQYLIADAESAKLADARARFAAKVMAGEIAGLKHEPVPPELSIVPAGFWEGTL
jgi:hypothetical protein